MATGLRDANAGDVIHGRPVDTYAYRLTPTPGRPFLVTCGREGVCRSAANRSYMCRFALLSCFLAVILVPGSAGAAVVATAPGGFVAGYVPPVVVVDQGEEITYANGDIARHNVIAPDDFIGKKKAKKVKWCSAYDEGQCPLFWSETIGAGKTTEVLGLERLKSGEQYNFYCSIHPNMRGTLVVR